MAGETGKEGETGMEAGRSCFALGGAPALSLHGSIRPSHILLTVRSAVNWADTRFSLERETKMESDSLR